SRLNGVPIVISLSKPVRAVGGNGRQAKWVALNPLGGRDLRTEVQERVQVDLVIEDAKSTPHNQIALCCGLISKAEARGKVVLAGVEEWMAPVLDHKAFSGNKVRDVVFLLGMHRAKVLVADAVINV